MHLPKSSWGCIETQFSMQPLLLLTLFDSAWIYLPFWEFVWWEIDLLLLCHIFSLRGHNTNSFSFFDKSVDNNTWADPIFYNSAFSQLDISGISAKVLFKELIAWTAQNTNSFCIGILPIHTSRRYWRTSSIAPNDIGKSGTYTSHWLPKNHPKWTITNTAKPSKTRI